MEKQRVSIKLDPRIVVENKLGVENSIFELSLSCPGPMMPLSEEQMTLMTTPIKDRAFSP